MCVSIYYRYRFYLLATDPFTAPRERNFSTCIKPQPLSLLSITIACRAFLNSLKYSPEQVIAVERATTKQRESKRWQEERQFRITASNFGLVIKRQRNHPSLAKQVLYKRPTGSGVASLMWGQQHESDALEAYRKTLSSENTLKEAGIFISTCGFLGASPDGLVVCSGNSVKVVEVKCPSKARHSTVQDMCSDESFYCSLNSNSQPRLKHTHEYYYQVQGQMAVSGIHLCDFVVWTPKGCTIETIHFDEKFWNEKCYPPLRNFYFYLLLPEIIYPNHPNLPLNYSPFNVYSYHLLA